MNVFFTPHPPILLEDIGGGRQRDAKATIDGMKQIALEIKSLEPEVIVVISPHGNTFRNGTSILLGDTIKGDFSEYGFEYIDTVKSIDDTLSQQIGELLDEIDSVNVHLDEDMCEAYKSDYKIDHGALVPLYFVDQVYKDYQLVHLTPGFTSLEEQYRIGMSIKQAILSYDKKVVVIASGDLSHCLLDSGPYEKHPDGPVFDKMVVDALKAYDPVELVNMDKELMENAGQCGLRPFVMGLGVLDGYEVTATVHSYEGPFGVGYLTASMKAGEKKESLIRDINNKLHKDFQKKTASEDVYIQLARASINHYVGTGTKLEVATLDLEADAIHELMTSKAGVFVSIHKNGRLRGCIGTTEAVQSNLADEIILNAISACSSDPRFMAVEEKELIHLDIKVDVLGRREPIDSIKQLDPTIYGVIVEKDFKRGLLLPDLDGINTPEEQVSIAKEKAGILANELDVSLYRFKVTRHE